MASPTLEDLRALGAALPPTERVAASETADVVGAIAAYISHGKGILAAAKEGGNEILAFLHKEIADKAEANGDPMPEKGSALTQPAPVTAFPPQNQGIDYDKLAAAIVKAQNAEEVTPSTTSEPDESGSIL